MLQFLSTAVIGSGTMGAGIAQAFLQQGYQVLLYDIELNQLQRAKENIYSRLNRLEEKGRIDSSKNNEAQENLTCTTDLKDLQETEIIIEAVPELLDLKQSIFREVEQIAAPEAILASNTSSLSITEIGAALHQPSRLAGVHFFNPAAVMPLVEIVQGHHTADELIQQLHAFMSQINKTPVVCKDTPGFIVNRIARSFYNEALKIKNEQALDVERIDLILKKTGNFKMGPFELQDLIGVDVNFATTVSLYNSFHGESRFRPQYLQERMVKAGALGQKTGGGFYDYSSSQY